jgi:hypothetical protein
VPQSSQCNLTYLVELEQLNFEIFATCSRNAIGLSPFPDQRSQMARGFDHGPMKAASKKLLNKPFDAADRAIAARLRTVAQAFVDLRQNRHDADYSYLKKWSRTEVQSHVDNAAAAFESWKAIRHERIAQDYLVSLLIKDRKE